ncbi:RDD family protein [Nocardioides KLBMP 9356]|uniref:RDD family protein n=1 Tax=Nocardioides potassii TaxID=2911371 RepID=A0ABS9HED4_9ACTN|nr:RDD family protein [Nocardioides potassii]MCF6378468.1 RDD family protein [Nocardioides potassii]
MNQSAPAAPATMGRRVAARSIDVGVSMVLFLLVNLIALSALQSGGGGGLVLVLFGLLGAWSVFSFWAMFARAALPGQLMLGLHHVDDSGRRAGGRTFVKYLLQAPTFGLALLITPLSIQAPNRSWFDRVAGVTLVDSTASQHDAAAGPQVAAPPAGWRTDESELTQGGHVATDASTGGMISAVPFEGAGSQVMRNTPPAVRREPAVVDPRPAAPAVGTPAPAPVATPVAPPPGRAPRPVAVLDSGDTFEISRLLVLGRAPRQSASLGEAELVIVLDQSVSANHLALGVDGGAPWVMDLSSTNGSWLEQDGRAPVRLEGMRRTPASPGAVIKLGRRTVTVQAR